MNKDVRKDMNKVISELEKQGVRANSYKLPAEKEGLGDVVEATLLKVGITQERFKDFFGLKECNCTKRKQWLNGLFSWHKKKK